MEPLDSGLEGQEAPPSMEQWVGDYDYQLPQRGDIRSGIIVSIEPSEIVVDIGLKRDGIVPPRDLHMLGDEELAKLEVGAQVPVYILKPEDADGNMIVSINIARKHQDWIHAEELQQSEGIFEEEVIDYNKGGLLVSFGNLRGFVPASQLSDMPKGLSQEKKMTRLKEYVGQVLPLKVIEVDRVRRRLIMSQRAAQREWRERQKEQLLNSLSEGEVRRGVVSGLADFGAFVDLGGADGLIHVSELSWDRVSHPREVLEPGQEVDVYVLRLDHERKRIGLSLKRLHPDPWSLVDETYHVDQVVRGVVSNVVDFGAFARLEVGIEGLIHVSEMADEAVVHPSDVVESGEEVWARIISIDSQRKRIGLSLRDVPQPEELEPTEAAEEVERAEPSEVPETEWVTAELEPPQAPEAPEVEEAVQKPEAAEALEAPDIQEASLELEARQPFEVLHIREAEKEMEPVEPAGASDIEEAAEEVEPTESVEATAIKEASHEPVADQAVEDESRNQ